MMMIQFLNMDKQRNRYLQMQKFILLVFLTIASGYSSCSKKTMNSASDPGTNPPSGSNDVSFWRTDGDQSVLLQRQSAVLSFDTKANSYPIVAVDSTQTFQTVDGFGFTLTGGSASVINQMSAASRNVLLKELFGGDSSSIGISYLRLSIGA